MLRNADCPISFQLDPHTAAQNSSFNIHQPKTPSGSRKPFGRSSGSYGSGEVEVAAAAQVVLEDALGGWMMFEDQSVAAVDESHKFAAGNQ